MINEAVKTYPNFKAVATTLREVKTATVNDWSALCWADGEIYKAKDYKGLEIMDRVGGGDSFASGLIYGRLMDIEIQRSDRGSGVRRARFHSSMIDRSLLSKGDDFEDLVDTYVIFITEKDKFGMGIPLYHIERKISEMDNALFGDGAHILYVNGEYRNLEHPVGSLMHDFNCKDAKDMVNPLLAEEVRYLKETEGGLSQMSRILEEMRNEAAEKAKAEGRAEGKAEGNHEKAVNTALKMIARGRDSIEEVAEITGLSLEEVRKLAENQKG